MKFDPLYTPYPSRRMPVYAQNGMVTTTQPLAAQAGLDMIKQGGNAIDAAIATAACLTVVEPNSNSIGGDSFALVWTEGKLHGLNASGPSPQGMSIEAVRSAGYETIPEYGMIPVTVPGTPASWQALSERFGKLPLCEVLKPAITYAEQGYPVSPIIAYNWNRAFQNFKQHAYGPEFDAWYTTFAPQGRPPKPGEIWRSPDHARTLIDIAETQAQSFYNGVLAEQIDAYSKKHGGFLSQKDLSAFKPEWVQPIGVNYRGYDVWEIPPNGQGIIALIALNILEQFDFTEQASVDTYHKQIEAIKLAFADGSTYITDPRSMKVSVEELLSARYAEDRRKLIADHATFPQPSILPKGGTVYLATADQEGNMVSFIQSNYKQFGSGIVVPGTGINLQNRGLDFSMNPDHANALLPGKRTYHTIIPGFVTKQNEAIGPFGVMGGFMQPQGHVQVMMNAIDYHLNPQAALDAPRWQWKSGNLIEVDPTFPQHIAEALARKGHQILRASDHNSFGRGQIIWRDPQSKVYVGGTEPRADGHIAAW